MSSNINDFVRPTDKTSRRDINKILSLIHDLTAQEPEEEGLQERIMYTPHVKLRTSTVTSGAANLLDTDVLDMENWNWRRKKPSSVDTYNLVHTQVGAGALTFPVSDTKFGARCDYDGTNYITIDDDTILKPTDKLTISMWLYIPTNDSVQHTFIRKGVTNTSYLWRIETNGDLTIRIKTDNAGGTNYKITITNGNYPLNTWFHATMTWKGTPDNRLRFYIDKVQKGGDVTTVGALYVNTDKLGIGANFDGQKIVLVNTRMALLSLLNEEVTQTWIDNHFDGLLDTSDGNDEITTIAFIGDDSPTPDAESGLFKSS